MSVEMPELVVAPEPDFTLDITRASRAGATEDHTKRVLDGLEEMRHRDRLGEPDVEACLDLALRYSRGSGGATRDQDAMVQFERRACALYLWLLGPTEMQLKTDCPCRS